MYKRHTLFQIRDKQYFKGYQVLESQVGTRATTKFKVIICIHKSLYIFHTYHFVCDSYTLDLLDQDQLCFTSSKIVLCKWITGCVMRWHDMLLTFWFLLHIEVFRKIMFWHLTSAGYPRYNWRIKPCLLDLTQSWHQLEIPKPDHLSCKVFVLFVHVIIPVQWAAKIRLKMCIF